MFGKDFYNLNLEERKRYIDQNCPDMKSYFVARGRNVLYGAIYFTGGWSRPNKDECAKTHSNFEWAKRFTSFEEANEVVKRSKYPNLEVVLIAEWKQKEEGQIRTNLRR